MSESRERVPVRESVHAEAPRSQRATRIRVRRTGARSAGLGVAAAVLVSLTACAGGSSAANCTPTYPTGSNASLISADGGLGNDPEATFPTPLVTGSSQVSVVKAGDGSELQPGDAAVVQITIYDGTTGNTLISTNYDEAGLMLLAVDGLPAFGSIAQCTTVGSRVAAVGPAGDLIGDAAIQQNGLPVGADDPVVMVVDLEKSFLGRADGSDQLAQAGFPSIVLAPDGRPGFTIPSQPAPTDLRIATLKAGSGARVKEGDTVVLNYTGVLWDSATVFESTWEVGAPAALVAQALDATGSTGGGLVPGFAKAVIGQRVGSQVIAVIPPEFGYPVGSSPASIPEGSTLVYVIDILGIDD